MKRALFDTNVVSYWMGDEPAFRPSLKATLASFRSSSCTFYISIVTLQEIMIFAHAAGKAEETMDFIGARFNVLNFDPPCALAAASLAVRAGILKEGTKSERRELIGLWQRDAAIAGTASHHAVDILLTANRRHFAGFQPHMDCKLHVLDAAPAPVSQWEQRKSSTGSSPPPALQ